MDIDIGGVYFQKPESKCKYTQRQREGERETSSVKTATPGPNIVIHETSYLPASDKKRFLAFIDRPSA